MVQPDSSFLQSVFDVSSRLETEYIDIIRQNPTNFTRHRLISVQDLFQQMLAAKNISQKNEISSFYIGIGKPAKAQISQTAFFNARLKFRPEALLTILQDLLRKAYANSKFLKHFKGYYVLAVDGSRFLLPESEDMKERYGAQLYCDNISPNKLEMALTTNSCLYDCLNRVILDFSVNCFASNEMDLAKCHLGILSQLMPSSSKRILIFDRGYAGIKLIDSLVQNKEQFLIRLPKHVFKKERQNLSIQNPDQWINVAYTGTRLTNYRKGTDLYERLKKTVYTFRFVNLSIKTDQGIVEETLLTNLNNTFTSKDLGYLYHLRWDVETCYRSLKFQFHAESFRGNNDILMRQEIFSAVFGYNIISMIECENETLHTKTLTNQSKLNRNFAIGTLKNSLLLLISFMKNRSVFRDTLRAFILSLFKNLIPIRDGRNNPRRLKSSSKDYFTNRRSNYCRSF